MMFFSSKWYQSLWFSMLFLVHYVGAA